MTKPAATSAPVQYYPLSQLEQVLTDLELSSLFQLSLEKTSSDDDSENSIPDLVSTNQQLWYFMDSGNNILIAARNFPPETGYTASGLLQFKETLQGRLILEKISVLVSETQIPDGANKNALGAVLQAIVENKRNGIVKDATFIFEEAGFSQRFTVDGFQEYLNTVARPNPFASPELLIPGTSHGTPTPKNPLFLSPEETEPQTHSECPPPPTPQIAPKKRPRVPHKREQEKARRGAYEESLSEESSSNDERTNPPAFSLGETAAQPKTTASGQGSLRLFRPKLKIVRFKDTDDSFAPNGKPI